MAHRPRSRYQPDSRSAEDCSHVYASLAALAFTFSNPAQAVEVAWEGHYRSRVRYFNSLSLASVDDNASSEEASTWTDHRLRIQPGFKISDHASVFMDMDVLPFVTWGGNPVTMTDPATGESVESVFAHSVEPPTAEDGSGGTQNIQFRRAWAQIDTGWGNIRFGRMPIHWGSGMVYNAGNGPLSEYGDTADRIQVSAPVGPVYLLGAIETSAENLPNVDDDLKTVTASVAYLGEQYGVGTYNTYRWQKFGDDSQFRLFVGDIWAKADLGTAKFEFETAFALGGGDLSESVNDVRITGFGAQLNAMMGKEKLKAGLTGGVATGDEDIYDTEYHTFSFDPDFNVALMMFEEPMPVLAHENANLASNGGREYGAVRLGDGVSNALYIKPSIHYMLLEELEVELGYIAAKAAKLPTTDSENRGYGSEVDLTFSYTPFENVNFTSTTGVFFPGKRFSTFEHEELGGGYSATAVGSRLVGTVEF